jgi:hypothetical protein
VNRGAGEKWGKDGSWSDPQEALLFLSPENPAAGRTTWPPGLLGCAVDVVNSSSINSILLRTTVHRSAVELNGVLSVKLKCAE